MRGFLDLEGAACRVLSVRVSLSGTVAYGKVEYLVERTRDDL